jgi:hypothetical protein
MKSRSNKKIIALVASLLLSATPALGQVISQTPESKGRTCVDDRINDCLQTIDILANETRIDRNFGFVRDAAASAYLEQWRFPLPRLNSTIGEPAGKISSFPGRSHGELPGAQAAPQQSSDAEQLAIKLSNPVASLISVPFQNNFDFGLGPDEDGFRYTMNFQPVIPISLNKDWNLISRTVLPVIHQSDVVGGSSQTGLGDIAQSFFLSPNKTKPFIWGAGPVLLIPSATNDFLGAKKFGIGPTVVVLKQSGPWTVGGLWNHIWSVAGADDRADVNSTFVQPFLTYTTKTAWTFTLNTESSYDWEGKQWGVPIHVGITKLIKFGRQPVSVGGFLRCWATSPGGGPQGCGFRFSVTPLFPKG